MSLDPAGLRARAAVLAAARRWFDAHGYLEVPTPALVPVPAVEPHLDGVRADGGWLRTSPELALKRVLAAGLPRIYEIGPCFRADEHGPWHAREFTMLEWYRAGASLSDLMDEVEAVVAAAAAALGRAAPDRWERLTVREAVRRATGIDVTAASAAELSPRDRDDWDTAFFRRWLEDVEPSLPPACFVSDWPASLAALAQVRRTRTGPVALRFEAYLHGVELANAFQEDADADTLRRRWEGWDRDRRASGQAPHPRDDAFLAAVDRMPPAAGIALGLDRLVAVLAGWRGIDRGRVPTSGYIES